MTESDLKLLRHVVAQLRHAYDNAVKGYLSKDNMRYFGDGMLAPQIRNIEKIISNEEKALGVESDQREYILMSRIYAALAKKAYGARVEYDKMGFQFLSEGVSVEIHGKAGFPIEDLGFLFNEFSKKASSFKTSVGCEMHDSAVMPKNTVVLKLQEHLKREDLDRLFPPLDKGNLNDSL